MVNVLRYDKYSMQQHNLKGKLKQKDEQIDNNNYGKNLITYFASNKHSLKLIKFFQIKMKYS